MPLFLKPVLAILCASLLVASLAACDHGSSPAADASADSIDAATDSATPRDAPADMSADNVGATDADGGRPGWSSDCDPLVEQECSLPWPSNLYLVPDSTRATGYTLQFGATSLPRNVHNHNVDPTPYRRLDGYGIGTPIMAIFPNIDISMMATEDQIQRSVDPAAAALLFEVNGTSLTQVPYFVELDSHETNPALQTLFMRPAVILKPATQYIVAFRNLVDTSSASIPASTAFAMLRDHAAGNEPTLAPRQARFDAMFALLTAQGIDRRTLTLAWDFNTASDGAETARLLAMRDQSLAMFPHGPTLTVSDVIQYVPVADSSGDPVDSNIALQLHGTMTFPNYLAGFQNGSFRGAQLSVDATGTPLASGTRSIDFWIRVPYSAIPASGQPATPHGLIQYGHGLLGSGTEVTEGYLGQMANQYHYILFASDLTGLSDTEIEWALATTQDISNFLSIADGLEQGMMQWALLARAIRDQLPTAPDIMSRGIVVDPTQLFYSGNSQGGIMGGTYVAMSTDISRGHLGVPGNNYSLLLERSQDFIMLLTQVQLNYHNNEDIPVAIALMQLLWDTTDPVAYVRHIHSQPFPGNTAHEVVLTPAKGDHQVSPLTNEILARTTDLGIALMANYDNQRTPWNIAQQPYPRTGSGVVLYDFGNPWPTPGNHIVTDTLPDPHELPRRQPQEMQQVIQFFQTGAIDDVCNGMGCHFGPCNSASVCQPLF